MKWWLILIIIPLIIFFFRMWLNRPLYYRGLSRYDFHRFLEAFIKQSSDGSLLFIQLDKTRCFIQFAKYITDDSGIIISFGFPEAPWSREYIGPLIRALESLRINYELQRVGTDPAYVTRFVDVNHKVVNLDKAVNVCVDLAVLAFNIMRAGESATYTIHHEGGIDPGAARSSLEKLFGRVKEKRDRDKKNLRRPNSPNTAS